MNTLKSIVKSKLLLLITHTGVLIYAIQAYKDDSTPIENRGLILIIIFILILLYPLRMIVKR